MILTGGVNGLDGWDYASVLPYFKSQITTREKDMQFHGSNRHMGK